MISPLVQSKTVSMRKTENLIKRVTVLEQRMATLEKIIHSQAKKPANDLKVKDLKNNKIDSIQNRTSASENISEAQKKEIMQQLEGFKKKSAEREKFIEKLLNED